MSYSSGMSPEERQSFIAEFLAEANEHLEVLNAKLLAAEEIVKEGGQVGNADIDAMFRAAHTIKGTASFISLDRIVGLTHEMETVLSKVKSHEIPLSGAIVDVFFNAFDALANLFKVLTETGNDEVDVSESVRKLKGVLEEKAVSAAPVPAEQSVNKPDVEDNKYFKHFMLETDQNINEFDELLVGFEKHPDQETTNKLFRLIHTIKGSAGLVDEKNIREIAHRMENILSWLRDKGTGGSVVCPVLFEGVDCIRSLMSALREHRPTPDISVVCGHLDDAYASIGDKEESVVREQVPVEISIADLPVDKQALLQQAVEEELAVFRVTLTVEAGVPMKSMKIALVHERFRGRGVCIHYVPDDAALDACSEECNVSILYCSMVDVRDIRSRLNIDGVKIISVERVDEKEYGFLLQSSEEDDVDIAAGGNNADLSFKQVSEEPARVKDTPQTVVPRPSIELSTIRIDSSKLDHLMNLSGELVIVRARFAQLVFRFNELFAAYKEQSRYQDEIQLYLEQTAQILRQYDTDSQDKNSVVTQLTRTFDLLETRMANMNGRNVSGALVGAVHEFDEVTSALNKVASDIQSGVMQARMVPVEGVFTRFRRIVRDISHELDKEVNLVIEGEDTELDKKIVDSLAEPLTHMIRNAVDHGVESKMARLAAGKSAAGTLVLRAVHRGNMICIEVRDDGAGMDPEAIAAKGVEKGLISQEDRARMSDREKLQLVFLPGFSTAEKVTGISGRGVGMDVVKNMVTSVKGSIDIETVQGRGTTFVLNIPLTLAIIQALLVVIGERVYAVPLESVLEIVKIPAEEIYKVDGNDMVKLRDHALGLVFLESIIGIKGGECSGKSRCVVVITDGDARLGVVVDRLMGEEDIVIKSLTDHFLRIQGISGASILGDGTIALILDPLAIIRKAR
jgi:two-component system chemotaxis sensor kinase CheA